MLKFQIEGGFRKIAKLNSKEEQTVSPIAKISPAKQTQKIAIRKIKLPQKYWCHTVVVSTSLKPHKNQWLCSANKFCFDEHFDVK